MARNIYTRLDQLHKRRTGVDRLGHIAADSLPDIINKSLQSESWQKRAASQSNTRYALGAMQEVGPEYTKMSIETAERVGRQLKSGLEAKGFAVTFELQGSVPLNVHIRGVSDVDLLNLDLSFLTYERSGKMSLGGYYTSPTTRTSRDVLLALRTEAEKILKSAFPAATIDTSGGKAIKIFGGSLARPVDVVPSHWHDTVAYQASRQKHDRGVTILDKKKYETIDNLPFLHIKRVSDQCAWTSGSLRKSIRLCKNVKADAETEGTKITLPSFDIAATMYHADMNALRDGAVYELQILAETQRHLDYLYQNPAYARLLRVPDDSRIVFDTDEKYAGLKKLSHEIDDLFDQVAKEQAIVLNALTSRSTVRDAMKSIYIAA